MPAVFDTIFEYQGSWGRPARCRLRLYRLANGMTVAIASELPDNPGVSITNFAAELATGVRRQFIEPGQGLLWVEHYPRQESGLDRETYDRVLLRWDGRAYRDPQWKPWSRAAIEALIGEALE